MDFEAPVDAWYVWLGVALVSVALIGVAVQLPSQPPPDAAKAANTIDTVASNSHQAAANYKHDAEVVKIDTQRVALRNNGGTERATIAFGPMTPLSAIDDESKRGVLDRILSGERPANVLHEYPFDSDALLDEVAKTRKRLGDEGVEWRPADGTLRVRKIDLGGESLLLVDF